MSLRRRFLLGRVDGEAVYAQLRATVSAGDDPMLQQLIASTVGRAGARLIDVTARAAAGSRAVQAVRIGQHSWRGWPPMLRLRGIGLMALTAVATHVAMIATTPTPGAWRWLLPGLVGAFGMVVLGLSYFGPRPAGTRD